MSLTRVVPLPDGRVIGVERIGAGEPVLYFHGLPGSRLDFASEHDALTRAGVELIALDRPGCGLSTRPRRRWLLDWPGDVEAACVALGLEGEVAMLGYSSGGKYALACAYALPERVRVAGVLAGSGPPDMPGFADGMSAADRLATAAALRARPLALASWGLIGRLAQAWPAAAMAAFAADLTGPDRELAQTPAVRGSLVRSLCEGLRQGAAGTVDDYAIEGRPWGFDPAAISVPVRLWHGEQDEIVPPAHSRWLAERIPDARLRMLEDAGHLASGRIAGLAAELRRTG